MTDVEALIRAVNPVPESGPGSEVEAPDFEVVWTAAQNTVVARREPRSASVTMPARRRRHWAGVGSAAGMLAAGLATALLLLSSGPAPAYAGWTATPAAAPQAAVTTALKTCGAMSFGRNSGRRLPAPVLSEARGRYVAVISVSHGQATACVTDGADSASQSGFMHFSTPAAGRIGAPAMYGSSAPGFPGSSHQRLTAFQKHMIAKLCANSSVGCVTRLSRLTRESGHVSVAFGRAGAGVTRVAFELPHRSAVNATVEHGWYFAWWPWRIWPSNARVTTPSGITTRRFTSTSTADPHIPAPAFAKRRALRAARLTDLERADRRAPAFAGPGRHCLCKHRL